MLLIVVDLQERIAKHIYNIEEIRKNTEKLVDAFKLLGHPIIYTEQVNLGRNLFGEEAIKKTSFSCWKDEKFVNKVKKYGNRTVILTGIETHICIFQTAIDMKKAGYDVEVAVDCTGSRDKMQAEIGIERLKQEGIKLASSEMIIYRLMKSAEHPKFREMLEIVKR